MADGVVKHFPGAVTPVVQFCLDNDIGIMQMPCPELLCASGGFGRAPHGKQWYEQNGLRETAREIAHGQVRYINRLIENGFEIIAIVGVEFSPACAVTYLNRGQSLYREQGIFVEELQCALREKNIAIPMIGISQRWQKKMRRDLEKLLNRGNVCLTSSRLESDDVAGRSTRL